MAIDKRSCELIKDIVSLGVSVNSVDVASGRTPLQLTRNVEVAALLLNLGAGLLDDLPDDCKQFSPIWIAARNCDADMFKLLADAGAVVDAALFRHYVTFGTEACIGQFICQQLKAQARYTDPQARLDLVIEITDVSFRAPRISSSKCVEWFIQTSFIHDLTAFVHASLTRWTEQQCSEVLLPLIVSGHFKPALETPFEDQCSVSIAIHRRMFALALTLANHGCSVSQLSSGKQMQLLDSVTQSNQVHLLRKLVVNGCCDAFQASVNELDQQRQQREQEQRIRLEAEAIRARIYIANTHLEEFSSTALLEDIRRRAQEMRRRRFMAESPELVDLADAGTVMLAVDPNDLVESSIVAVEQALIDNPQAFHNGAFAITYIGQDGYDAGGLMRDWLTRLVNELKDHSKGVLVHLERDGIPTGVCTLQPSRHWLQTHELRTKRFFRLLGFVIGVALSLQPPLPLGLMFPVSLCRSLRDPTGQDAPALSDLQEVDEDEHRSLCALMNDANAGAYGQDYVRVWSTPSRERFAAVNSSGCAEEDNPVVRAMSAIAGRDEEEEVALDEIPAYVDAVVRKKLVDDMRDQLNLVREGLMYAGVFDCELPQGWSQSWSDEHCAFCFYQKDGSCQWTCPAHEDGSFSLRWQYVSALNLRSTICGSQAIDIDEWQSCTDCQNASGRYDGSSSAVEAWFWEVVRSMNFSQQQQLLYWISGCMAPPARGFGHFGQRFRLFLTNSSSDHLPEAHT
jgi:hypothetical protein